MNRPVAVSRSSPSSHLPSLPSLPPSLSTLDSTRLDGKYEEKILVLTVGSNFVSYPFLLPSGARPQRIMTEERELADAPLLSLSSCSTTAFFPTSPSRTRLRSTPIRSRRKRLLRHALFSSPCPFPKPPRTISTKRLSSPFFLSTSPLSPTTPLLSGTSSFSLTTTRARSSARWTWQAANSTTRRAENTRTDR